jgi:hypothetical protein
MGIGAPALGTLPDFAPCISSSDYLFASFILYNELVNVRKHYLEFWSQSSKTTSLKLQVGYANL